ncbi:MAG: Nif3-like dinuclear metal center hexameric protein [Actinobacteria bacterium]|nr:Nif3-like dinuclear metal center hexameric protein [Actinomycetota bacterium]
MTETVGDWLGLVHELYPPAQAASWDAVGLHVGDPAWPVDRVLVALDVTGAVVDEAAAEPHTLVLAHHPLLFRPLARLTPDTAAGRTALRAARAGVAIAAAHTNLDVTGDGAGTSDPVVRVLDLQDVRPLTSELRDGSMLKLVVFVPPEALDAVLDAVSAAGAGEAGDYERCSFRVRGTGTFRPVGDAQPYSGEHGEDNDVDEFRLEVQVPRSRAGAVVRALLGAHPYEEVAYDLFPTVAGAEVGFGRIGRLPEAATLEDVAARIRADLPAPFLRFAGDPTRELRTVAIVGGSGDSLLSAAVAAGADVFVTGDLKHHVVLDALELGITLVDAGHHATEVAALPSWIERLRDAATAEGLHARLLPSSVPTGPWAGTADRRQA